MVSQIAGKKYGNNGFALNVECPMPIKKPLPVESTLIWKKTPLNISLVSFRYVGVILCYYFYTIQCIQ